jgi:hypothetical protein
LLPGCDAAAPGRLVAVSASDANGQITHRVVGLASVTIMLRTGHRRTVSLSIGPAGQKLLAGRQALQVGLVSKAWYKPRHRAAKTIMRASMIVAR